MSNIRQIAAQSEVNLQRLSEVNLPDLRQLLDVDGVFSAPHQGRVLPEDAAANLMMRTLAEGAEMSLATGRPAVWIANPTGMLGIVREYLQHQSDGDLAKKFHRSPHFAENGAIVVNSTDSGYSQQVVAEELRFPESFVQRAEALIKELDIGHFADWDRDKVCVLSVYVYQEGYGEADLDPYKDAIVADFREFADSNLRNWLVSSTAIAVDAHHERVSKMLASRAYVDRLKKEDCESSDLHFIAIGDSPGDFALYRGLSEAQKEGKLDRHAKLFFVFTGNEDGLEQLLATTDISSASAKDFIYAGVLGEESKIKLYSDATLAFYERLLY